MKPFKILLLSLCIGVFSSCSAGIKAEKVILSEQSVNLYIGETKALKASFLPENVTDKSVTWTTSNNVVSVDGFGTVTALKAGTSTVICTYRNDPSLFATCEFKVSERPIFVSSISLNKTTLDLVEEQEETLTATVLPENASEKGIEWTSENTDIATVENGNVIAVSPGETKIRAAAVDGSGIYAECQINVRAKIIKVESIKLNKTTLSLYIGDSETLSATVLPEDAENKEIKWTSGNPTVASVNANGQVSALKAGTATIKATAKDGSGVFDSCTVTVSAIKVTEIELNKTSTSIVIGNSEKITATVKPTNATNKDVVWTSDNSEVASVDEDGDITAKKVGTANITVAAQDGSGISSTCVVNVIEIKVTSIKILKDNVQIENLELEVGKQQAFTLDIQPTNATNKDIVWSSSDSSIASVSNGTVMALAKGNCVIKAENINSGVSSSVNVSVTQSETPTYLPSLYYGSYYDDDFSWTNTADLKQKLYDLMNNKRTDILNYGKTGTNWETNTEADHTEYDFEYLDVVYSSEDILASKTYSLWQREHAFAATLMTGQLTGNAVDSDEYKDRANDFHNLFAAYSSANGSRGNKNLGNATGTVTTKGDCKYDTKNFEPSNKDKGRLARALVYMATMNGLKAFEPLSLKEEYVEYVSGTNPAAHGNLSTLVDWADTYPVDRLEQQHNISIATSNVSGKVQGNRNAFVDYPQLVDYLYGNKIDKPGDLKHLVPSVYTLDMYSASEYYNFAIKTAKRTYQVGETISLTNDLHLVNVKKNNTNVIASDLSDFTITGISDNYTFTESDIGSKTINISKSSTNPINYSKSESGIKYTIEIISNDPIDQCSYKHALGSGTAKTGEFFSIAEENGIVHEMNMDNLTWNVYWENSKVGQRNETQGTQFGTKTDNAGEIYFETKDAFSLEGATTFDKVYFSGCCGSGKTCNVNINVNDVSVYSTTISGVTTKQTFGITFKTPQSGKIKIHFTNPTGGVYIHTLAINAIS